VAPRSFGVVVLVTMLDVAVARHSPISLKIASGKNLCVAFTSSPMFYVSAVKIIDKGIDNRVRQLSTPEAC
jgi:hypothetical protein